MQTLWLIAVRNLLQNRRRSMMLGLAIAAVTALLVVLTCLGTGVRKTMLNSALTLVSGHLNVGGYYKVTAGQAGPLVSDYKKVIDVVKQALPDAELVTPRGRGWARLVSDETSMQVGIAGVDLANEPGLPKVLKMLEGSVEGLSEPGSVLIFASQAKKFKVKTGDSMIFSVLTERGVNNTVDVKVCGVAQDMGMMTSWNVFLPQETLNRLNAVNDSTTGAILVYIRDMAHIERDLGLLREALSKAGFNVMDRSKNKAFWMKLQEVSKEDWTGQKLDLTTWEDEISYVLWALTAIDGLSFLLTAVLLGIIAVGIMNTLWISIRERTREIGTLRAIGMQRRRVMAMFVIEAFCLSVAGTVLGLLLGGLFAGLLNLVKVPVPEGAQFFTMSDTLYFAFDVGKLFLASVVIVICTTAASLFPSLKAARMKPVTAMSHI